MIRSVRARAARFAIAATLAATTAHADECAAPAVRLAFEGTPLDTLRDGVTTQLAAEMRRRGIGVCRVEDARALAEITMRAGPGNVVTIAIRDPVTEKQVTRDVPLGAIPADARALTLALAADELLRASWLETAMTEPPPRAEPVPFVVREAVRDSLPAAPSSATTGLLAFALTGDHAVGGLSLFGFDARASFFVGPRLALGARAGYRAALDVGAAHGDVRTRALLGGLVLALALSPRDARVGVELVARADVLRVEYTGQASSDARASSGAALGANASGGVSGWLGLGGAWRLAWDATLGAPLHTVSASDDGRVAASTSGLSLGVALGAGARF